MTMRRFGQKAEPKWEAKTIVTIPTKEQTLMLLKVVGRWAATVVQAATTR